EPGAGRGSGNAASGGSATAAPAAANAFRNVLRSRVIRESLLRFIGQNQMLAWSSLSVDLGTLHRQAGVRQKTTTQAKQSSGVWAGDQRNRRMSSRTTSARMGQSRARIVRATPTRRGETADLTGVGIPG